MGTLILIRHAKAVDPDGKDDHGRSLAGRGRRDAPAIGRHLRSMGQPLDPSEILLSSAVRAQQTWQLLSQQLTTAPPMERQVHTLAHAYLASAEGLTQIIRGADPQSRTVVVVAHNPGLADLLSQCAPDAVAPGGPVGLATSGVALIDVTTPWAQFEPQAAQVRDVTVCRGSL